jgi:hypothetical protein
MRRTRHTPIPSPAPNQKRKTRDKSRVIQVTPWGSELSQNPSGKPHFPESARNKSGNTEAGLGSGSGPAGVDVAALDPDLAAVVAAWPTLAPALRAGVLALVAAARPDATKT